MFRLIYLEIVDCKDLYMKQKKYYYLGLDLISVESLMVVELLPVAVGELVVVEKSVDDQD